MQWATLGNAIPMQYATLGNAIPMKYATLGNAIPMQYVTLGNAILGIATPMQYSMHFIKMQKCFLKSSLRLKK